MSGIPNPTSFVIEPKFITNAFLSGVFRLEDSTKVLTETFLSGVSPIEDSTNS